MVAYDVTDDRRRTRLFKAMKGFGQHTQFSVFECHLDHKEQARMLRRISKVIDVKEDKVKVYAVCQDCFEQIEVIGLGEIAQEDAAVVI